MQEYFSDEHQMDGSSDSYIPGGVPERSGSSTPGDKGSSNRPNKKKVRKAHRRNVNKDLGTDKSSDREGTGRGLEGLDKIVHVPRSSPPCMSCYELDRLSRKGFAVAISRGERGVHVRAVRHEHVVEYYNESLAEAVKATYLDICS